MKIIHTTTLTLSVSLAAAALACDRPSAANDNRRMEPDPSSMEAMPGQATAPERAFMLGDDRVLTRPEGYRHWMYVGAPVTPNDMNDGKAAFPEFHSVYIDPESYRHWEETGEFRDGTILIKELISVGGKKASSGNGYFMGEFVGLEAAIKSQRDFPDEPGNWAYFSFTSEDGPPARTAKPLPTATCNSCHQTTAATDYVFSQYYPVLRAAAAR